MQLINKILRRKKYEIPDSWAVCHLGSDRRNMMRINVPLKDFAYKSDFPVSTIFAVLLSSFDVESDIPFEFEDFLFAQLQDSGDGIVSAVVTNSETRDFIVYTKSESIGQKLNTVIGGKFPSLKVVVSNQNDTEWELFQNLLPNP